MVTTIQVQDTTLQLLKKLKEETKSVSYDETIKNVVITRTKNESLAGYLGKRSLKPILKELRAERRKSDRF